METLWGIPPTPFRLWAVARLGLVGGWKRDRLNLEHFRRFERLLWYSRVSNEDLQSGL